MRYFEVEKDCPFKPVNNIPSDQALTVIIQLPNGGIKCLAIPLEAVEEYENE
jgi:hypothetical protein